MDQQGERYTLFDTTGRVLETHPRGLSWYGWQWEGTADTAGRLLENHTLRRGRERVQMILRFNRAFERADTFPFPRSQLPEDYFRFARGTSVRFTFIPFSPRLHWRLDPYGYVWFGTGGVYRLYRRRLEGDTVRIIERTARPVRVTNAEEDSAVAAIVQQVGAGTQVDRSRIPRVQPAFIGMWVDDAGRLWVAPSVPAGEPHDVLDVFDPDGRYLGRVTLPFSASPYKPLVIRRDRFYTVTEDADGVPYVVRARIVRGMSGVRP